MRAPATHPFAIEAVDVSKSFGSTLAVERASITVRRGEVVALLGPSGSGKTTLLRTIAGFEAPDSGRVSIGGQAVAGGGIWVDPDKRRVGMVFQDGALFPHLSVADNVAFGYPRPGRVEECLSMVGLANRARSFPHELSGGERQRVALARALAPEPEVILLDEPFASLDATLRLSLREEIAQLLRAAGASALLVTHDQQEALSLADVVVVMREGRVEQAGPPEEVYSRPATRWSAEFLGAADVVPGTAADGMVECELGRFPADVDLKGPVDVIMRPEALSISAAGPEGITARVVGRSYYGHDQLFELELTSGLRVGCRTGGGDPWGPGETVSVSVVGPVSVLGASTS